MFAAEHITYRQTSFFSKIITDYLEESPALKPFYEMPVTLEGFREAIKKKQHQPVNRNILVEVLKEQYSHVTIFEKVGQNIEALLSPKTFTVCTAHQPNLFTGPLYFIYKILHTIKLTEYLKEQCPGYHFVPVYYMGSEDADFQELNHLQVFGKPYEWVTDQKGAVGRMKIDKKLIALMEELQNQLGVEPYGQEIISILKSCYQVGTTIQSATFRFVNELLGRYGIVVLIADDPRLKKEMIKVFEDDLFNQKPSQIVEKTCHALGEAYNVQAHPREINLFYLKDNIRERIIRQKEYFVVKDTELRFTEQEMRYELNEHPGNFSPNVILRGLYQETILPNLAFIGGGGELAYWLQLKDLFEHYGIAYPILVLRNSFLIVEKKWQDKITKLGLTITDLFEPENNLMKRMVDKYSGHKVSLNGNYERAEALFDDIQHKAGAIDPTLLQHVAALKTQSLKTLKELEKKMFRAEKRKFFDQQRQIQKIKSVLFPGHGLQERTENISGLYAQWGSSVIDELYNHSLTLEQQFCILKEQK